MAFVLFGGMVALQSSPTLDATKIAYLVGTILCVFVASLALWRARRTPAVGEGRYWLAASAALGVLITISFFVARAEGTSMTDWLRDVAAYGLFAAVPALALDGHISSSRKLLVGMLVVAGLLGGVSWAIEWLGRRQILDLPIGRLVFPSGQLPGLFYLFAMAMALTEDRRRAVWVLLAGLVLGLFLVTGTRSSLLLLVGPPAMMAIVGRTRARASLRDFLAHGAVAIGLVIAVQLAVSLPVMLGEAGGAPRGPDSTGEPGDPGAGSPIGPIVADRIGSLPGVARDPISDPSVKERVAQYEAAWVLILSSPVVGVGPGHSIDWIDVSGYPRSGYTADTPLVMPAKFGALGILVFASLALAYALTLRTALRRDRRSVASLTLIGFGLWQVVALPLGFVVEDKGASLALMLLLALAFDAAGGLIAGEKPADGAIEQPLAGP
jgi:hypothetical protein